VKRSTPLLRRTTLRRVPLRAKAPARARAKVRTPEPGREAWKRARWGHCTVCNRWGRLIRHHILTETRVRREGGDPWALVNSMDLGSWCGCHPNHHSAHARIPFDLVPERAVDFARRLLGDDRAALYFARFYAPARPA
jgi:hypothetical protein